MEPLTLFTMNFQKQQCNVYFLDPSTGTFKRFTPNIKLLSSLTETIVMGGETDVCHEITFKANTLSRCSFIFAVLQDRKWRNRFRGVVTPANALILFPLHSTLRGSGGRLEFPKEPNTLCVIGVEPNNSEFSIDLEVYANANGRIDFRDGLFNGYRSTVRWAMEEGKDQTDLPSEMRSEAADTRYFSKLLNRIEKTPLSSFRDRETQAITR